MNLIPRAPVNGQGSNDRISISKVGQMNIHAKEVGHLRGEQVALGVRRI
jgi:hypothetical protein